jgi:hypothetical protein
MPNQALTGARKKKNDEFYTQLADIEREINAYLVFNPDVFRGKTVLLPCDDPEWSNFTRYFAQNFQTLGWKRLISTGFAVKRKWELGLLPGLELEETEWATLPHGTIFRLEGVTNRKRVVNLDNLVGRPMKQDGDFRSEEVQRLRNQADIIVTNPPFSLFREFVAWLMDSGKQFLVIGNMNAITYKEVFPHIVENRLWLGATGNGTDMVFGVPKGAEVAPQDRDKAAKLGYVGNYTRLGNSCWFTNMEHGRRHQPLNLMTMAENLKYSRHEELRVGGYRRYDNYDAIEIPYTDAIPLDYEGAMGVPISFLDKYCPEQFEILGASESEGKGFSNGLWKAESGIAQPVVGGERKYKRLFIKRRG